MAEWNVDSLFGLTGDAFELERQRIISEYIASVPAEHRTTVLAKQYEVDMQREKLSPEEMQKWLAGQLTEQLENLSDQVMALKHIIVGAPTTPAAAALAQARSQKPHSPS